MNPDVAKVYGATNYAAAIQHYILYGIKEGRVGRYALYSGIFNATWYLNNNADLKKVFGTDAKAATEHWLAYGIKEGRQGTLTFIPSEYMGVNSDVAKVYGATNYAAAIQHYPLRH